MEEYQSKVTSKGQITLPKRVRDTLNLITGDQLNFSLNTREKQAVIKKGEKTDQSPMMDLLQYLLDRQKLIIVYGIAGIGKTHLLREFTKSQQLTKVCMINFYDSDIKDVQNELDSVVPLKNEESIIDYFETHQHDYVLIDQSNEVDIEVIRTIHESNSKLILVDPRHNDGVVLENETLIRVTLSKGKVMIEELTNIHGKPKIQPIYTLNK